MDIPMGRSSAIVIGALIAVILALFVINMLEPLRLPRPSSSMICRMRAAELALNLQLYEQQYGRLPRASNWIRDVKRLALEQTGKPLPSRFLKCPSDASSSTCSYVMNPCLSGRSTHAVPLRDRERTWLLRERCFTGSHGWVVYLDGHPDVDSSRAR
jgi:hypothetical protein